MAYRLSTDTRNKASDAIVDDIDAGTAAGTIAIRTGLHPAAVGDADQGTLLGTLTFSDPAFGSASNGTATGRSPARRQVATFLRSHHGRTTKRFPVSSGE